MNWHKEFKLNKENIIISFYDSKLPIFYSVIVKYKNGYEGVVYIGADTKRLYERVQERFESAKIVDAIKKEIGIKDNFRRDRR